MSIETPTPAEVRAVLPAGATFTDEQLQSVIDDAVLIVEKCIAAMLPNRQKAIVKWVAAHLLFTTGALDTSGTVAMTSMKMGDASETYMRGALGVGIASSPFGQRALELDTTGCLAHIADGKRKAWVNVL